MQHPQVAMPTLGRAMVFIDGENLCARYQAMLKQGWTPQPDVAHAQDLFVWLPKSVQPGLNVVLRATYYTYVQGDPDSTLDASARIKALYYQNYTALNVQINGLPNNLTPCVFQKSRGRSAKGVDIQLTVDMLTHAYQDNCDVVYLMSGDGDYAAVIAEVQRLGKQVFISAFSSGLSPKLRLAADRFQCLDQFYLAEAAQGLTPAGVERPSVW